MGFRNSRKTSETGGEKTVAVVYVCASFYVKEWGEGVQYREVQAFFLSLNILVDVKRIERQLVGSMWL